MLSDPVQPGYMDAGPSLTITGPAGTKTAPAATTGDYEGILAAPPSI